MPVSLYQNLSEIKSVADANQAMANGDIHVKIGLFGGRKFYVGNDIKHSLSMKELISKVWGLALIEDKDNKLSPEALAKMRQRLSTLNESGDLAARNKGPVTGRINMALLKMRRSFGPYYPETRFLMLDNLYKDLCEKEKQALKDHKDEFLQVLRGTKNLDQTELPPFLKEELSLHLGRVEKAGRKLDIPEDPNERQLEDILWRVKQEFILSFNASIRGIGDVVRTICERLGLDSSEMLPKDLKDYTNTEISFALHRLGNHDKSGFRLLQRDNEGVLKDYIQYLLKNPGVNTPDWFTSDNALHEPPMGERGGW